jgi:hypothetical protein
MDTPAKAVASDILSVWRSIHVERSEDVSESHTIFMGDSFITEQALGGMLNHPTDRSRIG